MQLNQHPSLGIRYAYTGQPHRSLNAIQQKMRHSVVQKIQSGEYACESTSCPICDGALFECLAHTDRYGIPTSIVICITCGLIQTNPRLTSNAYAAFYNSEYRPLYEATDELGVVHAGEYARGELLYAYLREPRQRWQLKPGAIVVEIGCGTGGILRVFRDAGHEINGIDVSKSTVNFGKTHYRLNLHVGTISQLRLPRPADLIIYSHVIEHLTHPNIELQLAHSLLSPSGVLYCEVPGVRYLRRGIYDFRDTLQQAHTFYFTLATLVKLLSRNGFDLIAGNEYIRSLFTLRREPQPIQTHSEYPALVRYLRRIEFERSFVPIPPGKVVRSVKRILKRFCP